MTALLAAQERNTAARVDVQLDAEGRPYIKLAENKHRYITKAMRKQKLFWGLTGCLPDVQHFKYCEPRAVATAAALSCKQCACLRAAMAGISMGYMYTSEEQLLCMLYKYGISSSMCAQVAVDWRCGRVDFFHAQHNVLIQADGSCHDKGYHQNSRQLLLQRDLKFCLDAYDKFLQSGGSVLRVRTCGSDMHQPLSTGFQLAAEGGVIVLSPSYSTVMCSTEDGKQLCFPEALKDARPGCVYTVRDSWHVIQWQ